MEKLRETLNLANDPGNRYRLIIINEDNSENYKKYCLDNGIKLIDLSLKLSELLFEMTEEEKEHEAWDIFKEWMENQKDRVLAFYNIDYMFSPELGNLDPIKNFNYYSRDKQIIIIFINARKIGNLLLYSEEGLPDYNNMDISENNFVLGWKDEDQ